MPILGSFVFFILEVNLGDWVLKALIIIEVKYCEFIVQSSKQRWAC